MYRLKVSIGRTEATVGVLCPDDAQKRQISSWSLRPMQTQQDAHKNPDLVRGLRDALSRMGVHRAYAPSVSWANARIVDNRILSEKIPLGDGVVLHRNRSVRADGVFIEVGQAVVMSVAGCPPVIAAGSEQMLVAHAGRDSLIDPNAITGKEPRKNISVVNAIVEAFEERGISADKIAMCMLFAISAEIFEHKFDGHGAEYNRALATFVAEKWPRGAIQKRNSVCIDLEEIFLHQALQAGVHHAWVAHSLAKFPAFAHTRDGHPDAPRRRNLIVVKRNQLAV